MNFWWREEPPLWSLALTPFARAYRAGALLHRALTVPARAQVPVISVGNLTVGGSGKTPVTLFLAQKLIAEGRRPAVLSRGYGRRTQGALRVSPEARAADVGDEPLLLARRGVSVWVGESRAELARLAVEQGAGVLLLDDGLQHHGLERDLDVIVADASNPLGNGALLPRGPMREPLSALGRVDRGIVWLTRCDQPRHPRTRELLGRGFPVVESAWEVRDADLRGEKLFLFAAIARPEGFAQTVLALGATVAGTRWFRDHHSFTAGELEALRREAKARDARLLTTEKDFVRLEDPQDILPLPVDLRILSGADVLERLP